jgi:hypothetical protein
MADSGLTIDVKTDIAEALKKLYKLDARQFPFVVALAMNRTMKMVKADLRTEMQRVFDKPTPFTLNSMRIIAATKDKLESQVNPSFASQTSGTPANSVLQAEIYGGKRALKSHERKLQQVGILPSGMYAVPGADAPKDAYGNVPGSYIAQMLTALINNPESYQAPMAARKRKGAPLVFFAVTQQNQRANGRLPLGVYQRSGSKIKYVMVFVKAPTYRKRFDFYALAERKAAQYLPEQLQKAAEYAIATSNTNISASDVARAIGDAITGP